MPSTRFLWPCHPHPLPDELLSSWLVRIAHGQRMKVQTFSELIFGKEIWNRDIDHLAPRWMVSNLSAHTGTPIVEAFGSTFRAYRMKLYRNRHESGIDHWILPLEMWHRKRQGFGLQFCPACLAEDAVPYYRKRWRVALYTVCPEHNCMVRDRCPACGSAVAFHRIDVGPDGSTDYPLSSCHNCRFDLRRSKIDVPVLYEQSSYQAMLSMLRMLGGETHPEFDIGFFDVLHQLCKLMLSGNGLIQLRRFALGGMGITDSSSLTRSGVIEVRSLTERHHLIQLGMWLITNPERIFEAWTAKAVRYNVLGKDFRNQPKWYRDILERCSDWRKR